MPLATRGLGPGRIAATQGLGPVWIILNVTVSPGWISVSVTLPPVDAREEQSFPLDLGTVYTAADAVLIEAADPRVSVSVRATGGIVADYIYRTDQWGPPIGFRWLNYKSELYDFGVGNWSFGLQIVQYNTGLYQKEVTNTDISGSAGSSVDPNVVISWPTDFFVDVPVDTYMLVLQAIDGDDNNRPYFFSLNRLPSLQVIPAPQQVTP